MFDTCREIKNDINIKAGNTTKVMLPAEFLSLSGATGGKHSTGMFSCRPFESRLIKKLRFIPDGINLNLVDLVGFEPMTSRMRTERSPN